MKRIQHMMFDFDGTLADTSEGIVRSMHYAYDKFGLQHEQDSVIRSIIGAPLEDMFSRLLHTKDENYIRQAVGFYRERYAKEGVREFCLYPQVRDTLSILTEKGIKLYIVSSKPEKFINEICDDQGIGKYFTAVAGVSLEVHDLSKGERMGMLMKEYGITKESGIMVGDRPEDAWAAGENGVDCIGVTYGFGKEKELREAGCMQVINEFSDLIDVLFKKVETRWKD